MSLRKIRSKVQTGIEPIGSPAQLRFHRIWQDIEKLEARQAKKSTEQQTLYSRFQTDILPLETEHCRLAYQQVERLIVLMGRKSLSDWQRTYWRLGGRNASGRWRRPVGKFNLQR